MFLMFAVGLVKLFVLGETATIEQTVAPAATEGLTLFVLLRAFLFGLRCAHRHRGDLRRRPGLQGAPGAQCCRHAALDGRDCRAAVRRG